MKYFNSVLLTLFFLWMGLTDVPAQSTSPKDTIKVARATWDTGWFQTEIFRLLIEELGHEVAAAQTMTARNFYEALADGEIDFWVNGWFPLHDPLIRQLNSGQIQQIGYEVKQGAMQGYLIDLKTAEQLEITSLSDLSDPEVAEYFDTDNDGKADLIGCNLDWSCYDRIEEHLAALELQETVEQVSGDYNPLANEAIKKWKNGNPLLMYTWTPNWTLGKVEPGTDVLWLDVPVKGQETLSDLEGTAVDPIILGYDLNDIRVVANRNFLEETPDVRLLFEQVRIPLTDIQQQNARMKSGEGSLADIRRHAREWIRENEAELRRILASAGVEEPLERLNSGGIDPFSTNENIQQFHGKRIRVVTQQVEPLVVYQDQQYSGFSIEVFDAVAGELGIEYSMYSVNSIAKMLDDLKRGEADVATAALGITSKREGELEFSHPYYDTGLQIMIPQKESSISTIPKAILSIIFSREVLLIFAFFFGVLLLSAHIIWFAERKDNEDFPGTYWKGIGISIWWAAVTVTTVGYGDKTPKGIPGRVFGLIWIFAGYFAFSYFTATVTSTVTLQEIESNIRSAEDLHGKKVATVRNSAAEYYLLDQGMNADTHNSIDEAIEQLVSGNADAVVYDAPVLQHYASGKGYGEVEITGSIFEQQSYGFALPKDSELRKAMNLGYLKLVESGEYQQIRKRWFGQ
jgi:ABC-type proline/glycine betaine transport system substrate-binding protein